jgi:hypothetical protein
MSNLEGRYKEVIYTDGTKHHYLGQTFDFSVIGECKVFMSEYITDELPQHLNVYSSSTMSHCC